MSTYEFLSVVVAGISMVISLIAVFTAGKANSLNKKIFKRSGVINLYEAWKGTNLIDPNNLIGPDVVKASNSLSLTSALWNHDIVEKVIIFQSFWPSYKRLYEAFNSSENNVPGLGVPLKSLLSSEMSSAYEEMKRMENESVTKSKI